MSSCSGFSDFNVWFHNQRPFVQGLIVGPRLFIAGKSIGPTGGHADGRRRTDRAGACICCDGLQFKSAMADGADEVRKAAREQMRQGADHVKIMMSGGVASPYDPLDSLQFTTAEVDAAVEEAVAFGRYVCAHAYTPEAITRRYHDTQRAMDRMGEELRGAKLDALIICGDDQYELFFDTNMPSIAIYYGGDIVNAARPPQPDPDWYKNAQLKRAEPGAPDEPDARASPR